jgi:3-dehydroquinate dehydratase type I
MCQTEQDALRLLQLLLELKAKNQRCIILGMGEHGITTRIFGTLWGNELIFAPETLAEQSAPGQLTRQQLDNITAILKG